MNLIEHKKELDQHQITNWDNLKFQKYLLEIIHSRHKETKIQQNQMIYYK